MQPWGVVQHCVQEKQQQEEEKRQREAHCSGELRCSKFFYCLQQEEEALQRALAEEEALLEQERADRETLVLQVCFWK